MNKKINMTKAKWQKLKEKGIVFYLFYIGLFKLGLIVGLVYQFLSYWKRINYDLKEFDFILFLNSYLASLPVAIILGVVAAFLLWYHFEEKFGGSGC